MMLFRDVARDAARSDDLAGAVAQGHLGGRGPGHAAIGQVLALQLAHDRQAGGQHPLFIGVGFLGVFRQEQIEIRAPENLRVIGSRCENSVGPG